MSQSAGSTDERPYDHHTPAHAAGVLDEPTQHSRAYYAGSATVPQPDTGIQPVTSAYPPNTGPEYAYRRPTGGRIAAMLLAIVALLLLIATGIASTLYVQQRAETDKANAALAQRTRALASATAQLDQARRELALAQTQPSSANSDGGQKKGL